ncbi:MAG: hypothetical protein Q7J79_00980, partial [Gemmatimonadales bacterium]|nr:hypothetical protein [Gemmatimonadales bacterium]
MTAIVAAAGSGFEVAICDLKDLPAIQEYGTMPFMKVTIEIPDDLYRKVKARSALEGRSVRAEL